MANYKWEPSHINIPLPDKAIVGGKDSDGSIIYVARAVYSGIKLPAKAIPSKRACYVPFNGLEILVERFEVLTGDSSCVSWEPSSQGMSVANSVSTDRMGHEDIYIGRAPFSNSLTVGKIQPSHRCLYIPYNGKEHRIEHYEVLVYKQRPRMDFQVGAVKNVKMNQFLIPSTASNCKILGSNATLHTSRNNRRRLPRCHPVDRLAIHVQNSLHVTNTMAYEWAHAKSSMAIPTTAIFGGRDSNFSVLYVGRSMHEGNLLPCKVIPTKKVAVVTLNGVETEKQIYEILTGSNSKWVASNNGNVPANALPGGYTKQGEVLYVGRANYNGGLIVGRIHKSHRCVYVGYNGREYSLSDYEVLIED